MNFKWITNYEVLSNYPFFDTSIIVARSNNNNPTNCEDNDLFLVVRIS